MMKSSRSLPRSVLVFAELHRRLHENASSALAGGAAIDSREEEHSRLFKSSRPQSEISILKSFCVHFGFAYLP